MKYLYAIIVALFIILPSCNNQELDIPKAKNGSIDLSGWSFEEDGIVSLDGSWEFYWQEIFTPNDFDDKEIPEISGYISVPGIWNNFEYQDNEIDSFGYATYRLLISGIKSNQALGIKIRKIGTAYTAYANGKLIMTNGFVGTNRESTTPQHIIRYEDIYPENGKIELIVNVANFHHQKGGIRDSISLGLLTDIELKNRYNLAQDLFLIGVILIMALYHFSYYFFQKNDASLIYFGLYCLIIAIRILTTGNSLFTQTFPNTPWELHTKLEFIGFHSIVFTLLLYINSLFPDTGNKILTKIIIGISIFFILMDIFTPARIYSLTVNIYFFFAMISGVYAIFILIKSIKLKKTGTIFILLGLVILITAWVSDFFYVLNIHNVGFLFPFGLLIFILSQEFFLSMRFSTALNTLENLTDNLETKVEERTQELLDAQKILEKKNRSFLESIHYAANIQRTILPADKYFDFLFQEYFIIWKPRDIVGGDFYFIEKNDETYLIGLADCTQHGVPGALMTTLSRSGIHQIAEEICNDNPSEIISSLNMFIQSQLNKGKSQTPSDDGLDIGLCFVYPNQNKMIFSGANINLFMFDPMTDKLNLIKGDKQSVGHKQTPLDYIYSNHDINIQPNTIFYMLTDGLIKQTGGEKGLPFGCKRFKKLLIEIKHNPLYRQEALIRKALRKYQKKENQIDDITIIAFKF